MTVFSPGNNAIENQPPTSSSSQDNIFTPPSHPVPKEHRKEPRKKEIVIRFDFPHFDATNASHRIAKAHLQMLSEWQKECPTIVIHTNNNRKLDKINLQSWGQERYESEFHVQPNRSKPPGPTRYSVIHRVETSYSLMKLKASVDPISRQHKCRITQHYWPEEVHDLLKIGHLIGLNPSHYSPQLAQQILIDSIGNKISGHKMPPF